MENQRENNDELLFQLLSEKLYAHYCGDKEARLSREEEQAVLNVLNSLQVGEADDFNPTDSFNRFCNKYMPDRLEQEDGKKAGCLDELMEKMKRDTVPVEKKTASVRRASLSVMGRTKTLRRVVMASMLVAAMFLGMNAGTYATSKMGFVEFLSKSDKGWKLLVTGEGNGMEMIPLEETDTDVFASWEEVGALKGMEGVLLPRWIPEECKLQEIQLLRDNGYNMFVGSYCSESEEKFQIVIEQFSKEIWGRTYFQGLEAAYQEKQIQGHDVLWYEADGKIINFFVEDKFSYSVSGEIETELVQKIIENLE